MKKIVKKLFAFLIILSLVGVQVFAETNDETQETEKSKMSQLEEQKQQLQEYADSSTSELQFVQEELSATVIEISELSQNIYDKKTQMEELEKKIEILDKNLVQVNLKYKTAQNQYQNQKKMFEKRLVAMYEIGDTSYLDILLNSDGLTDFLSNYYYISQVAIADTDLLNEFSEKKEEVEKLQKKLEDDEKELTEAKNTLTKNSIVMTNLIAVKNQKLQNLNQEESDLQAQIEEYQSQMQALESEIKLLSLTSGNSEYVGGTFDWPVPGYTRVSSSYGMRTHPITGIYKLHTGTDIGAPYGATFVASNDGIVAKAGYNGAYGNMVIVDHGGGISTLYAHGSEILVEVGQIVTKGTPVLKVGSTGYSTGPHAHFEIRVNGGYVNPMEYLNTNNIIKNTNTEKEIVELNSAN